MELIVNSDVFQVERVSSELSLKEYIERKVGAPGREDSEDPFCVVDLGRLIELHRSWVVALPTVTPFYAVKCNEDPALLRTLAALGTGFDCASMIEIKTILSLGVAPDRIVYANPCKQSSHIKYAARKGVDLMTFDNVPELYKIHKHFPSARLVLRIRADDPDAICQLGLKFGCSLPDGRVLLDTACELGLSVVGISFHVGSGSQSPSAYETAIQMAAELFAYGSQIGYQFSLLDIGGGFPGDKQSKAVFHKVTSAINSTLETHFSPKTYPGLRVIAEPGRYFACSTHTIAVNVTSKRSCDTAVGQSFMYYVNDGVYGSFNCILYDHNTPTPLVLKDTVGPQYPSSLWGPTCDGLDKLGEALLPELDIGDWVYFDDMGAYTVAAGSTFNGFLKPKVYYYVSSDVLDEFCELFAVSSALACTGSPSPAPSLCSSAEDLSDVERARLSLGPLPSMTVVH